MGLTPGGRSLSGAVPWLRLTPVQGSAPPRCPPSAEHPTEKPEREGMEINNTEGPRLPAPTPRPWGPSLTLVASDLIGFGYRPYLELSATSPYSEHINNRSTYIQMRLTSVVVALAILAVVPDSSAADKRSGIDFTLGGAAAFCMPGPGTCKTHDVGGGPSFAVGYRFNRWIGLYVDADVHWLPTDWSTGGYEGTPHDYFAWFVGLVPRAYLPIGEWVELFAGAGVGRSGGSQRAPGIVADCCGGPIDFDGAGLSSKVSFKYEIGVAATLTEWLAAGTSGSFTHHVGASPDGMACCHQPMAEKLGENLLNTVRVKGFVRV